MPGFNTRTVLLEVCDRVFAQSTKLFLISMVSNDQGNKGPECGIRCATIKIPTKARLWTRLHLVFK